MDNNYMDSILFDSYSWMENNELQTLFEEVWSSINVKGKSRKVIANMRDCLRDYLCSLLHGYRYGQYISITTKKNNFYTKKILDKITGTEIRIKTRYAKLNIKYSAFIAVLDALLDGEWIELQSGFRAQTDYKKGRNTRIWASQKLAKVFDGISYIPEKEPNELICIREKIGDEKIDIDFEDTDYTISLREKLEKINNLYNTTIFYHNILTKTKIINPYYHFYNPNNPIYNNKQHHPNYQSILIIPLRVPNRKNARIYPRIRAVFSNGCLTQGGRLYSSPLKGKSYHSLSSAERLTIKINGNPSGELDYCSLHISLLYAIEGISYNGDPYEIGIHGMRPVIKKLLLTVLNAKDGSGAIKSMQDMERKMKNREFISERDYEFWTAVYKNGADWEYLINRLREVHSLIRIYFCTGAGISLQNLDSQLMMNVLMHFVDKDITCLPVHDSVVIERRYLRALHEVMTREFYANFGQKCNVDEKK